MGEGSGVLNGVPEGFFKLCEGMGHAYTGSVANLLVGHIANMVMNINQAN